MAGARAPKQWSLSKNETITSFEAWRQNLQYTLSLDPNFAPFLSDNFVWLKKNRANPERGMTDDPGETGRTAAQKSAHLELMLGQIANFCPIISRNTIVKGSTSINNIWQAIRLHFGFQTSGSHFLDLNSIKLEPNERPEDLFQRLMSFVEDNLLRSDGNIRHHGEIPDENEEMTPSLENFIVLTWLRLIHRDLPSLVRQRYGTELRSQTIASLKPEISQALDSLLEEINANADARVMRTAFERSKSKQQNFDKPKKKMCVLCKGAGRPYQHFLSKCTFLPKEDRAFMSRTRQLYAVEIDSGTEEDDDPYPQVPTAGNSIDRVVPSTRRVVTKQSPTLKAFYNHHPLVLTIDTGAEISMIKSSVAKEIGAHISKSSQSALQADGVTPLEILGETHLELSHDSCYLQLDALVVNDLDVNVLAGIPFMTINDISVRPAKHQIMIQDHTVVEYGSAYPNDPRHRIRRKQAFVLRADSQSTVVWPGSFIEVEVPSELSSDSILAVEPRLDSVKDSHPWVRPHITESVGGKLRILNDTPDPQHVKRHEHFCQVRCTSSVDDFAQLQSDAGFSKALAVTTNHRSNLRSGNHSDTVSLDPDFILTDKMRSRFRKLLQDHDTVFDAKFKGYNGAVGPFQATVNMGPAQPPQRKGRVPQYARDKLVELQARFDELEQCGVFKKPEDVGINVEYVNPSFLVKKPSGGHRLVTTFTDVGRYAKPQPSLMPDVDSTLRTIAQWKYIIVTDLTSAFYQIPLDKSSMKYCGVVTPYRGIRVYARCAMGMPGSETALEELMCRILGDHLPVFLLGRKF